MNVYVYQAALYCEDCGKAIRASLTVEGKAPPDPDDEETYDSDNFPKGGYPDGEADSPQHCTACSVFLENDLTTDGVAYTREAIERALIEGKTADDSPALADWMPFYCIGPLATKEGGDDGS